MRKSIILIAHNIRSSHNVGALFRLADGLGVDELILTGYTPYPLAKNDTRLPHLAKKINDRIAKTALGAELSLKWQHKQDPIEQISRLKLDGYLVIGLEQDKHSVSLVCYKAPTKVAVLVGNEVGGIEPDVQKSLDELVEIPMLGQKESHNVVTASAMAIYQIRFC